MSSVRVVGVIRDDPGRGSLAGSDGGGRKANGGKPLAGTIRVAKMSQSMVYTTPFEALDSPTPGGGQACRAIAPRPNPDASLLGTGLEFRRGTSILGCGPATLLVWARPVFLVCASRLSTSLACFRFCVVKSCRVRLALSSFPTSAAERSNRVAAS